jgi:hypothetical protein
MWQAGGDDLSFGQCFHLNNSYMKAKAELNCINFLSEFVVCSLRFVPGFLRLVPHHP